MMKLSQETIITTYVALLSQSPWADVSLARIARELGVSKQALFHYFSTKQELNDAAFRYMQAQLESLASSFEAMDWKQGLMQASFFLFDHISEVSFFLQLIISRKLSTREAIEDKEIPYKGSPELLFAFLCYVTQIGSQILGKKLTKKRQIEPAVDQLLHFFQHGLGMPRGKTDPERTIVTAQEIGESRYLKALDEVIQHCGMQSVSITNFAKALGVAPSTLYSTFKDKKAMLEGIGTTEIRRMMGIVEAHQDAEMDIPTLVESIMRTVSNYLSCQVETAKFTDAMYVAFSQRKIFEAYPHMLRAFDALDAVCAGSGIFLVTLPASLSIAGDDQSQGLTFDTMMDFLFSGINLKEFA